MRTRNYCFLIGLMLAVILLLVVINVYQDSGEFFWVVVSNINVEIMYDIFTI